MRLMQLVKPRKLLDIGSGQGNITDEIAKFFDSITIIMTEVSSSIQVFQRLKIPFLLNNPNSSTLDSYSK